MKITIFEVFDITMTIEPKSIDCAPDAPATAAVVKDFDKKQYFL